MFLLAVAEQSAAYQTGQTIGALFWTIPLLLGIGKCLKIAKRETTNSKCVYALAGLLTAWLVSVTLTFLLRLLPHSPLIMILGGLGVLIFMIGSVVLAIIGLVECHQNPVYTQGRKQAIWTIVLFCLMLLLFVFGLVSGLKGRNVRTQNNTVAGRGRGGEYVFNEKNFRLKGVPPEWIQVDMSSMNPDVTLALLKKSSQVMTMVISENLGNVPDLKLEELVKFAESTVKGSMASYKQIEQGKSVVAGLDGIWVTDEIGMGAKQFVYYRWYGMHAGYFYQVVVYGESSKRQLVFEEAKKMLPRFEIVDFNRAPVDQLPSLGDHTSQTFGYSLKIKEPDWKVWNELATEKPAADYGGLQLARGMGFIIIPFLYDELPVTPQDAFTVLQKRTGTEVEPHALKELSMNEQDRIQKREVSFTLSQNGQELDYRVIAWSVEDRTLMLFVWAPLGTKGFEETATALQEGVTVNPKLQKQPIVSKLNKGHFEFHSSCFNELGIRYLAARQVDLAIVAFTKASSLQPEDAVISENVLTAYERAGRQSEALQYLTKMPPLLAKSPSMACWKASLLSQTGKESEAFAIYKSVFEKGYKDRDSLSAYARLLGKMEKWEELDVLFENFFKLDSSMAARLLKADIYHEFGKHDLAIRYLESLQVKGKVNPEICYRLINNHTALEHFSEALGLSELLITNKFASVNAYYQRASAEFSLGWYKQAKVSLEEALKLSPGDSEVKEFLTQVSARLGEGSNSMVKEKIEPVALPEEVKTIVSACQAPATNGESNAVICQDIHVYKFERGTVNKVTRYRRFRVLNQTGVSQLSTIKIRFNPLNEKVYVNTVEVRDRAGKVASQGSINDYYVIDDRNGFESSYDKTLCVPVAHLQPGSELEVVYTHEKVGQVREFFFERLLLSSSLPAHVMACCYMGDTSALTYRAFNGIRESPIKGGLLWQVSQPQPFVPEVLSPPLATSIPYLCLGDSTASWKKEVDDYITRLTPRFEVTPAVKKLASELTEGITSQQDKIDALLKHVQREYTYKAIEFGVRGVLPFPAEETIRRKYGDCKDLAVLARQLLSALSIQSSLVLVDSQFDVVEAVPSLDQFDHMILYVPEKKGCRFVDLTQTYNRPYDLVPQGLGGRSTLRFEGGNVRFERIPGYLQNSSSAKASSTITMKESNVEVHERLTLTGYCASDLRDLKELNETQQEQWFQHVLSGYEPYARVLEFKIKDDPLQSGLVLESKYQIEHRVQKRGAHQVLTVPNIWAKYYCDFNPMNKRTKPFSFSIPFTVKTESVIVAEGWKPKELPSDGQGTFSGGHWNVSCTNKEASCQLALTCEFIPGIYPSEGYNNFVSTVKKAIKASSPEIEWVVK